MMQLFDFHHHRKNSSGIYNLDLLCEAVPEQFSAGIHPKDIDENYTRQLEWLEEISQHTQCIAIGECGLDGIVKTDYALQQKVFREQLLMAEIRSKPVIIHCVRKHHDLPSFRRMSAVPMVIHGFNKNRNVAEDMLRHGFYLSFGNALLHNLSLQECFKKIPKDKFFLETDDSETRISAVYQKAAEIKGLSVIEIQMQTESNLKTITQL